jgi:nicotinate-nucleotide adenylyltransferase
LIGVLGGTFDPIHNGHVQTAMELIEHLGLDALHLVPLNQPVHRDMPVASAADRLAMVERAASLHTNLVADDCEIARGGKSWMIDTLIDFRQRYPEASIALVLGQDAFAGLDHWGRVEQLTALAHVIVVDRPGTKMQWPKVLPASYEKSAEGLRRSAAGYVCRCALTPVDVSSTMIRACRRRGEPVESQVPLPVAEYIREHELYRRAANS